MPSLKIKASMSTTQGCYKLCSEVSVLTAALAVVVGGFDGSKCALCLLKLSCEIPGTKVLWYFSVCPSSSPAYPAA